MQFNNADVVKKFIFRYLDLPLTNGLWNILVNITNRNIPNKLIELNKFLSNVCIIQVNYSHSCPTTSTSENSTDVKDTFCSQALQQEISLPEKEVKE
jgi:hypothetical protein